MVVLVVVLVTIVAAAADAHLAAIGAARVAAVAAAGTAYAAAVTARLLGMCVGPASLGCCWRKCTVAMRCNNRRYVTVHWSKEDAVVLVVVVSGSGESSGNGR